MKNKKILYIVATQYDNLGDLLINKCLIDELANYGDVYLDTKNVPLKFKELLLEHANCFELNTISKFSFKGKGLFLLPFIKNNKYSHLFKSPGPFGGAKSINDKIRYIIFYYLFFTMKKKGTKSYLVGNDLIVNSKFDSWIFKSISSVLDKMCVRSIKNVNAFKELGILNVEYAPDLCFMMKNETEYRATERKKVSISFRDLENIDLNNKVIKSVGELINFYLDKDYEIEFFYQVERDFLYNQNLFELFKNKNKVSFRKDVLTWSEKKYYEDVDVVLSNRLHVLLLAQTYACIPIALLDNNLKTIKIKDIYESVNLESFIYEELSLEDIEQIYLLKNDLINKIVEANRTQKLNFRKQLDSIFKSEIQIN